MVNTKYFRCLKLLGKIAEQLQNNLPQFFSILLASILLNIYKGVVINVIELLNLKGHA